MTSSTRPVSPRQSGSSHGRLIVGTGEPGNCMRECFDLVAIGDFRWRDWRLNQKQAVMPLKRSSSHSFFSVASVADERRDAGHGAEEQVVHPYGRLIE